MHIVHPATVCLSAAREAAIWELEEQHLKDKAQLARRQLKDLYFLKRHQMITRHEKVRTCLLFVAMYFLGHLCELCSDSVQYMHHATHTRTHMTV